jgi:hypothetical protein
MCTASRYPGMGFARLRTFRSWGPETAG